MAKLPLDTIIHYEYDGKGNINLTVTELVRCKYCSKKDTDECPMRHVEWIEYDDDGWLESDDVVYDNTVDDGYCHKGELRGDSDDR